MTLSARLVAAVTEAETNLNNPDREQLLSTAATNLKNAQAAESKGRIDHEAAELVAQQACERLANLKGMDSPTQQSLVDEEATRRKLVKLEAKVRELAGVLAEATEHRQVSEAAFNELRLAQTRAELVLEGAQLEREAVAFDDAFRGKLAAHQLRAREVGHQSRLTRVSISDLVNAESPLAGCVRRAREFVPASPVPQEE